MSEKRPSKPNLLLCAAAVAILAVLAILLASRTRNSVNTDDVTGDEQVQADTELGPWWTSAAGTALMLKAEDCKELVAEMKLGEDYDNRSVRVPGGARARVEFVHVPDETYKGSAEKEPESKAIFDLKVEEQGTYYPWARVWWMHSCANSIDVHVQREGEEPVKLGRVDSTYKTWQWVPLMGANGSLELKEGPYTVTVQNREDGARLSRILFTTKGYDKYTPTRPEG